jgi:hypothetical protein
MRTYQPLAHALMVLIYYALAKSVSVMTIFVWVRFLSIALLPLSFFAAGRMLVLRPAESAAAALLAPLVSTNFLYGIEYGSYLWAGSGLFTQAIAIHFLLLAIGLGFQAVRRGRYRSAAGLVLGLCIVTHFIYGHMGLLTTRLLLLIPSRNDAFRARAGRAAWVGCVALAVAGFELASVFRDSAWINHSRWKP